MIDYEKYPKRLNLGCGFDKREGYLNIDLNDFHDPDLVADVSDLSLLPSGYYVEILGNRCSRTYREDEDKGYAG